MDFKNSDITTGQVIDLSGADAAVALEAAATLAVAVQTANILPLTADGQLVLPAGVGLDDIKVVGRDLVIQMPDGTQMIVPDGAIFVPQIVVDGVAVPALNIAALLIGQEPEPAAGRLQSSGGNFADPVGDIGDPFDLGDLLPPTQLAFPEPEEREIIPELNDEEPTTIIVTPDQPAGSVSATASVNEAGLPARGTEPPGSSESANSETTTGSIVFDAPDGLASITLNGVAITAIGQVFVTPIGRLTITSIAPGNIGYSYTLTDNTTNPISNDVFAVVVTDRDGDTAIANLTINIIDDAPTARNDTDSVPAANYSGQTGNVITGAGTTSGNAGADTQGADAAVLSGIRAGTGAGSFAGAGTTVNGQYGTLTILANGSYTYTRNAGTPGGVNDVFTYQITDGDGDISTATLTISITDSPVTITSVPTTGAGTVVDEAGLPARGTEPPGSNAAAPSETTSGTITFTAPDGISSVAINGVNITGAGQVITVPTGTLLITGYNAVTGTLTYTFTLTDNTSGDATTQVFTITVTDTDGDTASSPFTVRIIDDVPTARNDSGTQATENAPVTVNIIANDTQGADGVNLATGVALVAGSLSGTGTLVYNGNGTFTYTPAPGEEGVVTFNYTITDGDGDVSTATVTINLLEDSAPTLSVAGDQEVNESGLPARDGEPEGSDASAPSETAIGTITVGTGGDSIASLMINGVNVTGGGTVITARGVLTVTLSGGVYSYSYTLTDNTLAATSNDSFNVVLTDSDGDTASTVLVIAIIDDAPTARNDSGTQSSENAAVTVNVFANDTQGADGVNLATNVALVAGSLTGAGTLVYNNDGTYTYIPAAGEEGVVTFNYTITDGDGDVSTATVTINLLRDSVPTLDVAGDSDVNESGLPARGGEPEGSDAAAPSETAVGTITVGTGSDSVASLVINGVNVTAGGTVTTALGTLVITVSGGVYSYSYTLADNTLAATSSDTFTIVLTDSDGDTASSNLVIAIIDDAPTAVADTDSIAAGSYGPATGNVISDSEGDGGKDVQGADGVTVTNVAGAGGSGGAGTAINGLYGILTLNADGSYSYVRNAGSPGGVSDVFTYTITDGDGDTSTTTLTIAIADSPVSLTLPVKGAAGTVVEEAGLPAGSNAASDSEKTSGTIAYVAADGPAIVTIDGVAVTAVGQTFTGAFGTLTITSIANGVIGYEYLLTTNTSGDATFDDFAIVVTDQDGDSSNGTLVVDIVDDVPTARADVDSVTEDAAISADGNVLTGFGGVDANGTDGVADTQGADGASVTSVAFGATAGTVGGSTAGEYGTLTLNADGSYSYVLNNSDPRIQGLDGDETLTEIFTYTITDGDGDARTTTLTITINGSDDPITINGLNIEGPELVVDDDDLPDGSSPNAPALTKTGSFTVNGVDGIASIKVGGTEVFVGQTIVTASGTFTITAISSPADGNTASITISYSFTLNDNTTHPDGAGENSITESFEVVVTDTDGSTDTDFIDVRIIDDVPTAVNDTDSIAAGEFGPATGNVITDAEGDGGADTRGADGANVSAITGAAAGTVGGTTAGLYGVLTLNADGSYSYVRNAGTPGGVSDVFTYTITDSDGDSSTATLTIAIADAKPLAGPNAEVLLDDDALTGGNAGGTGDDVDAANLTGTLAASGGDGPLSWAYTLGGAPAGFNYVANGSGVDVFQGATKVLAITLNTATGAYTVTQLAPIVHAPGSAENNQGFTISYNVTDTDGDASSGTLTINVDDDTPTASNDVDEILSGSNAPATGNVITDAEGDGGADSVGADGGAAIVAITGFGGAGTVGGVTNGQYGKLTINADGSYSYVRNAGTPGNVEDVFTYTLTDADGDTVTATLTISIEDARPITGLNATVLLDDDALAGGNAGGTGDDANAANLTGTLAGSGGDGALTWAYQTSDNPAGFTYVANGAGIDVFQGATKVLVITLNSATGAYSVAQVAPIVHANGGDENNQLFTINYTVTDADGDAAAGTLTINVDDDSPTIVGSSTQPVLVVDETALGNNATASFAGVFTTAFGADGPAAANSVTYGLSVVAGPSGLVDTATGEAINLVMNGAIVEGRSAVTNQLVFTVSVAANGDVTLDQIRAVVHNDPADPDEPGASAATITDNLVKLTATAIDKDGDAASSTVNIGQNLQFEDDGPSVTASTTQPTLVVDDTTLGVNASADFSSVFAPLFGADGPAIANSVVYALAITAGPSGLVDVETGEAVNLVLNGSVVEGRSATTNQLVFTLSVDASGSVTLDQIRAVQHNDPLDADEAGASAATLTADNLVRLVATVTDKDGDTASATANIGQNLQFKDDGPSVTASTTQPVLAVDETTLATNAVANFASVFTPLFGADGAAAANSVTYALGFNAGATGLVDTATGLAVVLTLEAGQVVGRAGAGGAIVFTVTVAANGDVTLDQQRAVVHNDPADPDEPGASAATLSADNLVTLTATVTDRDGDKATATANIGQNFQFEDDGPGVTTSPTEPVLAVDETVLATNAIANFAAAFVPLFGADGAASVNSLTYALGFNAGATGIIDTATGLAVVLTLEAGQVVGRAGAGGAIVFTVSVAANGDVTLDQQRAVVHNDPADPDEPGASAATLSADNLITLTATATDKDGDTATATVNLGQNLQFEDDGPSVTALGAQPTLVVDDTTLGANASASFAGVFAPLFGTDGAATVNPVTYALAITAGPSGLVDVATGEAVNLVLNGSVVEGRSATTNALVFTLTVDASGIVTLDQIRAVQHNDPADADEAGASAATLSADNLIRLIATVTDKDGDTATAIANIGQNLQFKDDGPGAVNDTVGQVTENAAFSFNVFGNDSFGADGVDTTDVTPPAGVTFTQPPVGQGTVSYNPGTGLFTFTPAAGQQGSTSFTYTIIDRDGDPSTATVTVNLQPDSAPVTVNVVAAVDDDGLAGNNPASTTGDIDANAGEVGAGVGNEAVYTGQITVNFGNDTGTVSFANLHNTNGTVGTETVTYTWSGTTLTATVNAGARNGTVLYTVNLTPSGAYTVTLLDNVLHASGGNEASAPVVDLNYLASDSDGDTSTAGKLSITFNDDAPTLGTIQNGTANNLPGSAVTTGALGFVAGADGAGAVGAITANTAGITSGGKNIVTNQVGNVLTGYADVDGSGTFNVGDTAVFTLTVNPSAGATGQYIFDLIAALDPTVTDVPIGSGSSFGVGPSDSVVVTDDVTAQQLVYVTGWSPTGGFTPAEQAAWQGGASPTVTQTSNVNGSTQGWGLGNNNFDTGEFLRFDFGTLDDYDGLGGYTPPGGVGPIANVSYATFSFFQFTAGETVKFVAHYTNGGTQFFTIDGATDTGTFTISAPAGAQIAWIDVYQSDGDMKLNLTNVGVASSSIDKTIGFTVQLSDGDGDLTTTNPFSVRVADGLSPSLASSMLVVDIGGGDSEFAVMAAGSETEGTPLTPFRFGGGIDTSKSLEQARATNVTAAVIAASLVGLPGIADALAAPAPDAARLEMLPDQETAMPDQVDLVGGDDNIVNEGEAGLSADTETTRITDDDNSSLQSADDDATATLDAQPLTPLSDGFTGGADVVDIADILPSASPMGSDAVMHNILDLAAAGLTAASNDNPVELAIENVVDEALPDTMIDRLVEAFEADADVPVVSAASASDSSGYLVELINQSVSSSPDFATIHVDPFGSQYNDMTTTNNG